MIKEEMSKLLNCNCLFLASDSEKNRDTINSLVTVLIIKQANIPKLRFTTSPILQVTDREIKETVEVKRADIRLLQPPWADELEDAGSHPVSAIHMMHSTPRVQMQPMPQVRTVLLS